jgi:hypothetical protein
VGKGKELSFFARSVWQSKKKGAPQIPAHLFEETK